MDVIWQCLVISAVVLDTVAVQPSPLSPCTYGGVLYQQGQSFVGADGCHVCRCDVYGVRCIRTNTTTHCLAHGATHNEGDSACTYGGGILGVYVGDVFTARDGCNTCLCTEQGLACTGKPCSDSGFARPQKNLYGHCRYADGGENVWYPYPSQWQAVDGCNTCVCVGIGNYQGPYICTNGICVHPHKIQPDNVIG